MGDMTDYTLEQAEEFEDLCSDFRSGHMTVLEAHEEGIVDDFGGDFGKPYPYYSLKGTCVKSRPEGSSCPRCNSPLVTRSNKKTQKNFLGCSSFPECKFSCGISSGNAPFKETNLTTGEMQCFSVSTKVVLDLNVLVLAKTEKLALVEAGRKIGIDLQQLFINLQRENEDFSIDKVEIVELGEVSVEDE